MRQGELERVSDSKMNSFLNKEISFEGKILLMINFAEPLQTKPQGRILSPLWS